MSQWGKITLWDAAADGNLDLVKKRLDNTWTQINAQDVQGKTAVGEAAKWGHLEVVKFMKEKGADLELADTAGSRPLHLAAFNGKDDVVSWLIHDAKCDINARDADGNTPLIKAASRGHISTVKLLLQSGADKKIKNNMNNDVYICCQSPAVREVLDDAKYVSPTQY
eukprot:TRINITY_DN13551_c0_g1_i1.p1 TRINITY_DN13551_c0_g1~~TRINITY_DN13551_c0_g1_i1.p1  ORF type:complete len:167 (-),score=52.34 TRINITY_DN13551_c0_g1_i1:61-561(-)